LLYNLLKDQSLNANEIDFTTGDEPYKLKISNSKTEIYFVFSSLNFKGSLIKLIMMLKMYIKKILFLNILYRKIFY
jgi:CelD/BcsL family acetyltransferase involved in cellulose biosynthesis